MNKEMIVSYINTLHIRGIIWVSPTQIGTYFGKRYDVASSWACRHLKVLLKDGRVRKNNKGHYCINIKGIEDKNTDIISWLKEVLEHDGFKSEMDRKKATEFIDKPFS